jgi:hypothetical protein
MANLIATGARDMDATGTPLQTAGQLINAAFAPLFAAIGVTPQVINTSKYTNSGLGDSAYVGFTKINANFATLAQYYAFTPLVINVAAAAYNGAIGAGDPGKAAMLKVNANFAAL